MKRQLSDTLIDENDQTPAVKREKNILPRSEDDGPLVHPTIAVASKSEKIGSKVIAVDVDEEEYDGSVINKDETERQEDLIEVPRRRDVDLDMQLSLPNRKTAQTFMKILSSVDKIAGEKDSTLNFTVIKTSKTNPPISCITAESPMYSYHIWGILRVDNVAIKGSRKYKFTACSKTFEKIVDMVAGEQSAAMANATLGGSERSQEIEMVVMSGSKNIELTRYMGRATGQADLVGSKYKFPQCEPFEIDPLDSTKVKEMPYYYQLTHPIAPIISHIKNIESLCKDEGKAFMVLEILEPGDQFKARYNLKEPFSVPLPKEHHFFMVIRSYDTTLGCQTKMNFHIVNADPDQVYATDSEYAMKMAQLRQVKSSTMSGGLYRTMSIVLSCSAFRYSLAAMNPNHNINIGITTSDTGGVVKLVYYMDPTSTVEFVAITLASSVKQDGDSDAVDFSIDKVPDNYLH